MIGDVLTSSILFEPLRKKFPKAQLHYLIYKHTLPVVQNHPFIDEFILYEDALKKGAKSIAFMKQIRQASYDVVIDVYSKIGTALISATSGATTRISYRKWYTSMCYTHTVQRESKPISNAGLAIENRLCLLQPLEINPDANLMPRIYLEDLEMQVAKDILQKANLISESKLIMISVLGSSMSKTYPYPYLAKLLDQIVTETNAQLLFNYIPAQMEEALKIYELCSPGTQNNIHLDIFGKSLREFMALTAQCDALIGNEGGAVNMAKALGIPTFAIFAPQINKQDWSVYENESTHISVHLEDFQPDLFQKKSKKELHRASADLYQKFNPELISEKLKSFLKILKE